MNDAKELMLAKLSIEDFLKKLASKAPAPGGGAAAALSAAQAAALFSMVTVLSLNNDKYLAVHEELAELKKSLDKKLEDLMLEMDKDAAAFSSVIKARRLPKETEDEKRIRREAIQEGFKEACLVPLDMIDLVLSLLIPASILIDRGNVSAITDVGTGIMLLESALKGAGYNVMINLNSIKDVAFRDKTLERLKNAQFEMDRTSSSLLAEIDRKIKFKGQENDKNKRPGRGFSAL